MERIKELDKFQKAILIALAVMLVYFTVAYGVSTSRKGFAYQESILVAGEDGANTIYSGKIEGKPASFTVTPEKVVTFQYGDRVYGPYTAKEDPTAIPKGESGPGVEVRNNGEVIFRGCVKCGFMDSVLLVSEDGTSDIFHVIATMSDGTAVDGNGNIIDSMEPDVRTILQLMHGPDLTSYKGAWPMWILGVVFSVVNAISMLYADELFRWRLSWRVSNPYAIEPSDWEIGTRYVGWFAITVIVFLYYQLGLNYLQ